MWFHHEKPVWANRTHDCGACGDQSTILHILSKMFSTWRWLSWAHEHFPRSTSLECRCKQPTGLRHHTKRTRFRRYTESLWDYRRVKRRWSITRYAAKTPRLKTLSILVFSNTHKKFSSTQLSISSNPWKPMMIYQQASPIEFRFMLHQKWNEWISVVLQIKPSMQW